MPTAEEMKEYRENNPGYVDRQNRRAKARSTAMRRLAQENERRFRELLNEELRKNNAL